MAVLVSVTVELGARNREAAERIRIRRELLLTVEESTDRLTDLISNILAMSRIQAGAVSVQVGPVALDEPGLGYRFEP